MSIRDDYGVPGRKAAMQERIGAQAKWQLPDAVLRGGCETSSVAIANRHNDKLTDAAT